MPALQCLVMTACLGFVFQRPAFSVNCSSQMGIENPTVSFVIPCHNEAGNLRPLVAGIHEAMKSSDKTYEIVITDDFSSDNSWDLLKEMGAADPRIRAQRFAYNCGQSAAL